MSISHKSSNIQIFRLMAYRRALHPELFNLQCRRMYRHGEYEAEGWILPSGHVVRFQVGDDTMTEVVVENARGQGGGDEPRADRAPEDFHSIP